MKQWDTEYWEKKQQSEAMLSEDNSDSIAVYSVTASLEEEFKKAEKKALSLLQHMDRTEWELCHKLRQADFSEEATRHALEYVRSFHYVDDMRYATRFVEIYKQTRSIQRMKQDLRKRGVKEDIIAIAMEEADAKEGPALQKALDKLLAGQNMLTYEQQQKVMAKLYRRGFRKDAIYKQIEQWKEKKRRGNLGKNIQ